MTSSPYVEYPGPFSVPQPSFNLPAPGGNQSGAFYQYQDGDGSLSLWSPFPGLRHPVYTSGAPVTGTLTLHLAKDTKLEDIHVKVRGEVRVATSYNRTEYVNGQARSRREEAVENIDILNLEQVLWRKDQGSLAGGPNLPMVQDKVLAGKYDFQWGPIVLPDVCQDSRGTSQRLPLPASFYKKADHSLQYIRYYVKVTATKAGFHITPSARIEAPFQFVPLPAPTPRSFQSPQFIDALIRGVFPPDPEVEPNSWMSWRNEDKFKGTLGITSHGTLITEVKAAFASPAYPGVHIPFRLVFTPSPDLHTYSLKHPDKAIVKGIKFNLIGVIEHTAKGHTDSDRISDGEEVRWGNTYVQYDDGRWETTETEMTSNGSGKLEFKMKGDEAKRVMLGWIPLLGDLPPSFTAHGLDLTYIIRLKVDTPGLSSDAKYEYPVTILSGFENDGRTPKLYDLDEKYWKV